MTRNPGVDAHLAVRLPEIVAIILEHVARSKGCRSSIGKKPSASIYQCLLVNRLWHYCAARIVYRHLTFEDTKVDFVSFTRYASLLGEPASVTAHKSVSPASLAVACPAPHINLPVSSPLLAAAQPNQPNYYSSPSTNSISRSTRSTRNPCLLRGHKPVNDGVLSLHPIDETQRQHNTTGNQGERMAVYRQSLRSLTLRRIKEDSIQESLQRIGRFADRLDYLEIYICDTITDAAVLPFLYHGYLTSLTLAGCHQITDETILKAAEFCVNLEHLDLRACGLVSDVSIIAIANCCPRLRHLNVGRIRDRDRITSKSISLIARQTQVAVLGLAGCEITDECMVLLAQHRAGGLERISVNNCQRLTNKTIQAYVAYCPNLTVFEMKECHLIDDWESVATLVKRKVLLTLCEQQNRACSEWAKENGYTLRVRAPVK